jgi:hypothetical protein
LIEKSIRSKVDEVDKEVDNVMWDNVKTWVPDKYRNLNENNYSQTEGKQEESIPKGNTRVKRISGESPSIGKTITRNLNENDDSHTVGKKAESLPKDETRVKTSCSGESPSIDKTITGNLSVNDDSHTEEIKAESLPKDETRVKTSCRGESSSIKITDIGDRNENNGEGHPIDETITPKTDKGERKLKEKTLTHFPWTVNRIFYAVGEDELRKKYFTEYVMVC